MQKIILIAVAVVALSQGIAFLNDSYPEGGFVGASKRTEVYQMMASRGEDVAVALRSVTPRCFESVTGQTASPLAVEMFGEVLAGLTTMPSAKLGKEPTEAEIGDHQAQNMAALVASFAPKLAALTESERAAFDQNQSALEDRAPAIVACALEAAHDRLGAGQANG